MDSLNIDTSEFIDGDGIVHQCCMCKKFNNLKKQQYEELAKWQWPTEIPVSHGYCPPCSEQFKAEIRAYQADKSQTD